MIRKRALTGGLLALALGCGEPAPPPTPADKPRPAHDSGSNMPRTPEEILRVFDADGDGSLSREEWPGPLERFGQLDHDDDGLLSEAELE